MELLKREFVYSVTEVNISMTELLVQAVDYIHPFSHAITAITNEKLASLAIKMDEDFFAWV